MTKQVKGGIKKRPYQVSSGEVDEPWISGPEISYGKEYPNGNG